MILRSLVPHLARFVAGVSVVQTADIPADGPLIYVANHTSHLDFVVLWSALPDRLRERTRPVAARDYWATGVRNYMACHVFQAILIDRRPAGDGSSAGAVTAAGRAVAPEPARPSAVDLMCDAIAEGWSLILFPEGTRGDGTVIAPFRSGLYHVCRRHAEIPVVPVYLQNLSRILPKGGAFPVPLLSRAIFGAPTTLDGAEDRDAFLARLRASVEALGAL